MPTTYVTFLLWYVAKSHEMTALKFRKLPALSLMQLFTMKTRVINYTLNIVFKYVFMPLVILNYLPVLINILLYLYFKWWFINTV